MDGTRLVLTRISVIMNNFSIDLKKSKNDIKEESSEETLIERNRRAYDLNDTHLLKVSDTVMNIKNMMEPGVIVTFENERNHVIRRVGCIKTNTVSMNKVRYTHPSNPSLIDTLPCS